MSANKLTVVTVEQATFIEGQTSVMLAYTIDCLDVARTEGNNVLQWLFGVIVGGLGAIGALWVAGYYAFAGGFAGAVLGACIAVTKLLAAMKARPTQPPGNLAANLNTMLDEPIERMRWRSALGDDLKIEQNLAEVNSLSRAVENARRRFVQLPYWLGAVTFGVFAIHSLVKTP